MFLNDLGEVAAVILDLAEQFAGQILAGDGQLPQSEPIVLRAVLLEVGRNAVLEEVVLELVEELEASLVNFHSVEHRKAGGLDGVDRDGVERRFPLLSASIAAVEVDGRRPVTAEEVADALRETKRVAKAKAGCSCMLAVGTEISDLSVWAPKAVPSALSQMGLFAVGAG